MKLYVLNQGCRYEGTSVLGIFSTLDKAEDAMQAVVEHDRCCLKDNRSKTLFNAQEWDSNWDCHYLWVPSETTSNHNSRLRGWLTRPGYKDGSGNDIMGVTEQELDTYWPDSAGKPIPETDEQIEFHQKKQPFKSYCIECNDTTWHFTNHDDSGEHELEPYCTECALHKIINQIQKAIK